MSDFPLRATRLALIGLIALFCALLVYQSHRAEASPPLQGPPAAASPTRGAALWPENCLPCHGATGLGDGPTAAALEHPPTNFTDTTLARERTLAGMYDITANGRIERLMPPWKARLTEQQMWDVVAYAQTLSVPPGMVEQGALVYAESCAECHGAEGIAAEIDLTEPTLLIEKSDQALFDGLQAANAPHETLATLDDDALWQSIAYIRTLSFDQPSFDGVLTGQLRNGTTGEMMANSPITLYAVSSRSEILQTYTSQTDADGQFIFEKLNIDHTIGYALEGAYQGINYVSPEPAIFLPDNDRLTQDLLVYETTDDETAITPQRLHRIMVFEPSQIRLADVYVFEATGDRTYIGQLADDGQPATLKVDLPDNAFDIEFQDPTIRENEDHFLSEQPVVPDSETFVSVQYSLPLDGADYLLATNLFYPIPSINILAADFGQTIESDLLEFQGTETFQGNRYQLLRGSVSEANQTLIMDIQGLDIPEPVAVPNAGNSAIVPGSVGQDQTILLYSLLGLGGVILAFSLLYADRNRGQTVAIAQADGQKHYLLTLLSELDKMHKAGDVDEGRYQQLRAENRAKLKQVLLQEQGPSA